MENNTGKFCYSTDEEMFSGECGTREQAISEGISDNNLNVGDFLYIGEAHQKNFMDYVDIDRFLENISEAAEEHAGEVSDGWPFEDLTEEKKKDLENILQDWASRNNVSPGFYGVEDVQEIVITQEHLDKADKKL